MARRRQERRETAFPGHRSTAAVHVRPLPAGIADRDRRGRARRQGLSDRAGQDTLFVADARTGRQLAAWPVPQVSGVAADARGRLLVGSGSKIVALDAAGRPERTLADAGGPIWDLKTVPGGGLVASVGAPRQQVVYFDAAGRELRALGRRGGRPKCGKMIADAFRDPVGLCVMSDGTLLVAEKRRPQAIHPLVGRRPSPARVPWPVLLQRHVRHRRAAARVRLRRYPRRPDPLPGRLRDRPVERGPLLDRMPTRTRACRWRRTPTRRSSGGRGSAAAPAARGGRAAAAGFAATT